jgi:hypothetical protein
MEENYVETNIWNYPPNSQGYFVNPHHGFQIVVVPCYLLSSENLHYNLKLTRNRLFD